MNITHSDIDWTKLKGCNILVTGATGLIGQYMVYTLMHLNNVRDFKINVCCLVRNIARFKSLFKQHGNGYYLNYITEIDLSQKYDYIIHLASSTGDYNIDPIGALLPNVFLTKNLLQLSLHKYFKGFLFFSSGEANGKVDKEIITEDDYGYLDPTDIRNCYGESKRMGELLCKSYFHQYDVPTFCVRPVHIYSPSMNLQTDKRVYAEFITNIIEDKDIVLKSDGLSSRNFCYITDAVDGFFRVLLHGEAGQSYNVGSGTKILIKDLAEMLVDFYPEKKLVVTFAKRDENYLESKIKDYPIYSIDKIKQLGYMPKVSIEEGFKKTIRSFQ